MSNCQNCARKCQLFLCSQCERDLKDMLLGMAQGQKLPSGHRAAGWIEYLEDSALGRTRLGESARRGSDTTTPLPVNLGASQLYNDVHTMLTKWAETVSLQAETLAIEGTQ